jgi:hypothetical protein
MFLHPHCPCSYASVEELSRLLAKANGRSSVHVVFIRPAQFPQRWEQTDLWRAVEGIPDVQVSVDIGGVEAQRFGAVTSGSTLVYDASGALLFQGGVTGGRGHAGDNPGKSAVLAAIQHGRAEYDKSSVFGCSLIDRPRPGSQKAGATP